MKYDYWLIKFRAEGRNGWQIWIGYDLWTEFVERVNKATYPVRGRLPYMMDMIFETPQEVLQCFRLDELVIEEVRVLESKLIEFAGYDDGGHDHIEYCGNWPDFIDKNGKWL